MKQILFCLLTFMSISIYGQENQDKTLFVVDSIPVFGNINEEEGTLSENTVDHLNVITNKADFGEYKIYDFDKIIFVFTKEYTKRSEEIRRIPTTKRMYQKEGKWCLIGSSTPYTGRVIDYYLNGIKERDGFLKKGLVDGLTNAYYKDGGLKFYRNYSNGIADGESGQFFPNGKLQQKGVFKNGKEDGFWQMWYSTGAIKLSVEFKSGKSKLSKDAIQVNSFVEKGQEAFETGDYAKAVVYYTKAIELNSNLTENYFYRGTAYLYDFKFDEAVLDFDKAISLEPLYMEAFGNRAFARIRKYEFKDSRALIRNSEVSVYAAKENIEIPADEKTKICSDLKKCYELGCTKQKIIDAMKKYCE